MTNKLNTHTYTHTSTKLKELILTTNQNYFKLVECTFLCTYGSKFKIYTQPGTHKHIH